MTDEQKSGGVNIDIDFTAIAIVVLIVFCVGKPDLLDALIHYFMQAKP